MMASRNTSPRSWASCCSWATLSPWAHRGFSQSTCLPRSKKSLHCSKCNALGLAMYTASIWGEAAISSKSVNHRGAPCFWAKAWARSAVRE